MRPAHVAHQERPADDSEHGRDDSNDDVRGERKWHHHQASQKAYDAGADVEEDLGAAVRPGLLRLGRHSFARRGSLMARGGPRRVIRMIRRDEGIGVWPIVAAPGLRDISRGWLRDWWL